VVARRGAKTAVAVRAVAAAPTAERTSELSNGVSVRSFVGMSLRRALDVATADGLVVEARGSGFVTGQQPAPGTLRAEGHNEIVLYLEPSA
jgi:hypothetical protein